MHRESRGVKRSVPIRFPSLSLISEPLSSSSSSSSFFPPHSVAFAGHHHLPLSPLHSIPTAPSPVLTPAHLIGLERQQRQRRQHSAPSLRPTSTCEALSHSIPARGRGKAAPELFRAGKPPSSCTHGLLLNSGAPQGRNLLVFRRVFVRVEIAAQSRGLKATCRGIVCRGGRVALFRVLLLPVV